MGSLMFGVDGLMGFMMIGTSVATERIQTGMMLAVDGDACTVTLLDEVDV